MAKWGEITWIFLHTLSIQVTEEQYTQHAPLLLQTVKTICNCLPCPDCQSHATEYMRKRSAPPTLSEFQKMLWEFHNTVNGNTQKRKYPIEILQIYKVVNLTKAFHFCRISISTQPYNPNMAASRMQTLSSFKQVYTTLHKAGILS